MVILATATYKGVEHMETTEFCGETCHSVMIPEFTAYNRSPHARVACVSCHIGPGADWFVKSKLSGSWQMVSVALDLYPTPIPTPVHNLRPADPETPGEFLRLAQAMAHGTHEVVDGQRLDRVEQRQRAVRPHAAQ